MKSRVVDMSEIELKGLIARVMERCASERFITSDKIVTARRELKDAFPDLEFDFDNNAFVDPSLEACGVKSISELASTKRKYIKRFSGQAERTRIGALVSKTYNATKEVMLRKVKAVDEIHAEMLLALQERKNSQFGKLVKNVEGTYDLHYKNYEFYISGNPIDLLQKSTGMPWELASCERYGGDNFKGVYSDIEIGNMVCVLQKKGGDIKIARVMLRWCLVHGVKPSIGIEELWYYAYPGDIGSAYKDTPKLIAPDLSAMDATAILEKLLLGIGYMDYEDCVTPYKYGGYSDTGGSNVNIRYTRKTAR